MNQDVATTGAAGPALLRQERQGAGVLRLTLASPPANLLSEGMLAALQEAVSAAAADSSTRVLVVAAEGKIFSGGHDLKELTAHRNAADRGRAYFERVFDRCSRLMQALPALPMPVVAEVGGLATAAGCQLVASCDIVVASDEARFGVNGIDVGLFCSTPMVALSRNVSPKAALDMLMTGEPISAERAREAGLVSRVVPASELRRETERVCDTLLARPADVLRLGKRAFYEQLRMPVADAYRLGSATIVGNMLMDEAVEGIAAFVEKRKPKWPRS